MRLYSADTSFTTPEIYCGHNINSQLFHCYWNGSLNEKHLLSIKSFYLFNKNHRIILWVENCVKDDLYEIISNYCEIKLFHFNDFQDDDLPTISDMVANIYGGLKFRADLVRLLILYIYGGCWFDLDCLCLRNFDPLFSNFKDDVCVYRWQNENYPNNAIFWSLGKRSETVAKLIRFLIDKRLGWGFQQAKLDFKDDIDLLVLPCGWFDGGWLENPYNITFDNFFMRSDKKWDFITFFSNCFCFHWHNRWNNIIEAGSPFGQLVAAMSRMSN